MWAVFIAVMAVVFLVLYLTGIVKEKRNVNSDTNKAPALQVSETDAPTYKGRVWQDDWIMYEDSVYEYNDEIKTFLIIGIDKEDEAEEDVPSGTSGGQADFLFLTVINPVRKRVDLIGINRNTMTDIDIYDEQGNYETTVRAQIAVQHGFGDGGKRSCEYQVKAVSGLMCDLPVHGYVSVNMSAIGLINDAVGGVTITPGSDFSSGDHFFQAGVPVELDAESAYVYVRNRDVTTMSGADDRLIRQKEYMGAFLTAMRQKVKTDPTVVINLFMALKDQMVTDLSIKDISALATRASGYSFGEDSFHILEGETVMGDEFLEFYPDEDALYRLLIDVFYEKVE